MRRANVSLLLGILFLISLTGCDQSARLERKAPVDVVSAKMYFNVLRKGQYDQIEDQLDPALKSAGFRSAFDELVATIPAENPSSVKTVWVNRECEEEICSIGIVQEYRYGSEILLFNVVLRKEGSQSSIVGMHIRVIPDSFMKANEFRLSHKGFPQYAILSMAILFPLFSLYVLVLCIRSQIGPRKWAWAIFILVGVSRLGVNWTTGKIDFQFLSFQVLSAAAYAEPYSPWMISVSIPLGAILFLIYRNSRINKQKSCLHS